MQNIRDHIDLSLSRGASVITPAGASWQPPCAFVIALAPPFSDATRSVHRKLDGETVTLYHRRHTIQPCGGCPAIGGDWRFRGEATANGGWQIADPEHTHGRTRS